jgi:TolA-binding protein
MQPQETTTAYFFKLWPWIEANKNRLIFGAVIAVIAGFLIAFHLWRQNQKELAAGQALTEAVASTPPNANASQLAGSYSKIAVDFPDTRAGERAAAQSAAVLFEAGKYTESLAEFQQFLKAHPDSVFSPQAALGVAASLDAQGKTDLASSAYQRVISRFPDPNTVSTAKFALAQIDERQGKLAAAENLYEEVARSNPNGSLGSEAAMRAMELKTKLPPASTPGAPPLSLNFNTKP